MFGPRPLVFGYQTRNRQGIIFRFGEVNDLAVGMGLKRCECCQKINSFQDTRLALRVRSHQHNNPLRDIKTQAGETAKVGERKMLEVHKTYVIVSVCREAISWPQKA